MSKGDWDSVIRTDLDSVFNMTKQVMDGMVDRGWGRVDARGYARAGGDYAEPQYGRPVLSWFNSGLNGQGRPLAGLGRSPAWRF
jgi:hypothetical protein